MSEPRCYCSWMWGRSVPSSSLIPMQRALIDSKLILGWIYVAFSISILAAPLESCHLDKERRVHAIFAVLLGGSPLLTEDIYVDIANVLGSIFGVTQMGEQGSPAPKSDVLEVLAANGINGKVDVNELNTDGRIKENDQPPSLKLAAMVE